MGKWFDRLVLGIKKFRHYRDYERHAVDLPVMITVHGEESARRETIANWSPRGIFIRTIGEIPLNALVTLEFQLSSDSSSVLRLAGQIVRHQFNEQTRDLEGVGVMFTDLNQSGIGVLQNLLDYSSSS